MPRRPLPAAALLVWALVAILAAAAVPGADVGAARRELQDEFSADQCAGTFFFESWSDEKRDFCCRHYGNGCRFPVSGVEPQPAAGAAGGGFPAAQSFDCDEGIRADWPGDKQRWCCSNKQKCFVDLGRQPGYRCSLSEPWSVSETEWCCMYRGVGCDTSARYSCDLHGPLAFWPVERTIWCCTQMHVCRDPPGVCSRGHAFSTTRGWCCRNDPNCDWPWDMVVPVLLVLATALVAGVSAVIVSCTQRSGDALTVFSPDYRSSRAFPPKASYKGFPEGTQFI